MAKSFVFTLTRSKNSTNKIPTFCVEVAKKSKKHPNGKKSFFAAIDMDAAINLALLQHRITVDEYSVWRCNLREQDEDITMNFSIIVEDDLKDEFLVTSKYKDLISV